MGLKKAENQVKILLADTIMALCRNTLNQHAEISVEGLLGITLDNDEIFLVSLNQTIKNPNVAAKKRSIEQDNDVDRKDSKKSRKDSDNDQDSDSESEKKPRRRKRHKKRRSRSSAGESESSSGEGSDTTIEENSYNTAANSTDLTDVTNSQNVVRIKREQDEDEDEDLVIVKEELSENIPSSSAFPFMAQSFQSIPQLHGTSLNNFQPNSSMNESISSHNPPMHISPHPQPGTSVSQSGAEDCLQSLGLVAANQREAYGMSLEELTNQHEPFMNIPSVHGSQGMLLPGTSLTGANQGQEKIRTRSRSQSRSLDPMTSLSLQMASSISQMTPQQNMEDTSTQDGRKRTKRAKGEKGDKSELQKGENPQCPLCGKSFKNVWSVRRHIICHTGQKDYDCSLCSKRFVTKWSQERHMQNVHNIPVAKDEASEQRKVKHESGQANSESGKAESESESGQANLELESGQENMEFRHENLEFSQLNLESQVKDPMHIEDV